MDWRVLETFWQLHLDLFAAMYPSSPIVVVDKRTMRTMTRCDCYACRARREGRRGASMPGCFPLIFGLILLAGSMGPSACGSKPPCAPLAELEQRYSAESDAIVSRGDCDAYELVAACPAWMRVKRKWDRIFNEAEKCQR